MQQAHNILVISVGIHKKAGPRPLNGHKGKDSVNALDPSESSQQRWIWMLSLQLANSLHSWRCVSNVFALRNEKSQTPRLLLCKQCSVINKLHTTQGLSGMSSSVTVPMEISGIPAFPSRLPKIMPYEIFFFTLTLACLLWSKNLAIENLASGKPSRNIKSTCVIF